MPKKKIKYPNNIQPSGGYLYFQKVYKGKRYSAPLGLKDNQGGREQAKVHPEVQMILANMNAEKQGFGKFNPSDHPLLKEYHTQSGIEGIPTFKEYSTKWLKMKKPHVSAATHRTYRDLIRNLWWHFDEHTLDKIDREAVEDWLAKAKPKDGQRGLANLNDQLRRLKSIMLDAAEDYDEVAYKLRRVKPLKSYAVKDPEAADSKDAFFTIEELDKMYWKAKERMRCMMMTSFFANLRPGELAALQRPQIDFEKGTLRVIATLGEKGELKEPKSKAGYRTIQMHPSLTAHLKNYLNTHDEDWVFITERGNPFTRRQSWEREFKLLKAAAEVRDVRWYGLRKAFATYKYACTDAVPANIAAEMGHTDIAMTLNTYSQRVEHLGTKWDEIVFPLERPTGANVVEITKGKAS